MENSQITPAQYKALFHARSEHHTGVLRFTFHGCAVSPEGKFVFITQPFYTQRQFREAERRGYDTTMRQKGILSFDRSAGGESRWSGVQYLVDWNPLLICPSGSETGGVLCVESRPRSFDDVGNRVFTWRDGVITEHEPLYSWFRDRGGFVRGSLKGLRSIAGIPYLCGQGRTAARWMPSLQWEPFTDRISEPLSEWFRKNPDAPKAERSKASMAIVNLGFNGIDGFAEDDLYTAGGEGDVWHFDGSSWSQLSFPNKMDIHSLCCGADGQVYVCGRGGQTFAGRNGNWTRIEGTHDGFAADMVWFDGRIWQSNEDGLWVIRNGRIEQADVPDRILRCAGSLATDGNVLLLAGIDGAAWLENGEWHEILSFDEMEESTRRKSKPQKTS